MLGIHLFNPCRPLKEMFPDLVVWCSRCTGLWTLFFLEV